MSYLLELLSKGLEANVGEMLQPYIRPGAVKTSAGAMPGTAAPESPAEPEELAGRQPDQPEALCRLGLADLQAMRFPEAAEHLTRACRQKPDFLTARLALASACDEMGLSQEALEHLRKANQTRPGIPSVLLAIGYCLEKLARSDEAAESYRDAIAADAGMVPARQRLAAIALLRDEIDEAVEQYEYLRQIDSTDAAVRATLAHLYYRCRRYDESIREFEIVIAMEPDNWALMDDEVEVLVEAGQIREAAERLYMLIEAQGPFADLHLRLADLLSRTGADEEATRHYLAALSAAPDYLEAMIGLGRHHLNHARWDESAETFGRAAEINDRLLTCYVGLGVAKAAAGKPGEAVDTFGLAAAVEPNSTTLLSEMAALQLKAATAREFQADLEDPHEGPDDEQDLDHDDLLEQQIGRHAEEVARSPGYADLRYRYGVLLRAEGRLGEALEQFAEAVRINPAYVAAIIRLGTTQQDIGQIDQAIETFKQALELKGDYVDLHYRLAVLHTDRRQFEEALAHMEKAASLAPGNRQIRAALALSLQNMGLLDRVAATWRSLTQMHAGAGKA